MKVLVIGDSYGLPRMEKDGESVALKYQDTYPELLRRKIKDGSGEDVVLVNHCRHANTTYSLMCGEANEILYVEPDYIIIQLGLADLWPCFLREVPPLQVELVNKDPWVTLQEFDEYLKKYFAFAQFYNCKIIVVNIPQVSASILKKDYRILERINEYNGILSGLSNARAGIKLVDLFALSEQHANLVDSDGIHPTPKLSAILAELIWQEIKH